MFKALKGPSLDFMVLCRDGTRRPREYPLGDFSLCIAFGQSSWSLLEALSLALSQVNPSGL